MLVHLAEHIHVLKWLIRGQISWATQVGHLGNMPCTHEWLTILMTGNSNAHTPQWTTQQKMNWFVTAQYMPRLVSGCPSQAQCSMEMTQWTKMVFTQSLSTLCYNGILVSPKIKALPSETLSWTLDFVDFSAFSPQHIDCYKCCQLSLTITSLSYVNWTPIFLYNTFAVAQSILQFVCDS